MTLIHLPVDVIQRVSDNLDQHDCLTVCLASKKLNGFYPTSLQFARYDAPLEDYFTFAHAVLAHDVDTIEAIVNPHHWNMLQPILENKSFKKVGIYPENYEYGDTECWIPSATEETKSGFVPHNSKIRCDYGDDHRIEFTLEEGDAPEPFPWIHEISLNELITTVELDGTFTCLSRIDPELIDTLHLFRYHLGHDDIKHAWSFDCVWLKECTFADDCEKIPFMGVFLNAHFGTFKHISSLPACTCIWLDLEFEWKDNGDELFELPSELYAVYEEAIEVIEVFGSVTNASEEDIMRYVKRMFPNALNVSRVNRKF